MRLNAGEKGIFNYKQTYLCTYDNYDTVRHQLSVSFPSELILLVCYILTPLNDLFSDPLP